MKNTFEQQIYEIFGTTDPKELRKLSKDAKQYQQLAKKEAPVSYTHLTLPTNSLV